MKLTILNERAFSYESTSTYGFSWSVSDVDKLLLFKTPLIHLVISILHLHLDVRLINISWVISYNYVIFSSVILDWTIEVSSIQAVAPLPWLSSYCRLGFDDVIYQRSVNFVVGLNGVKDSKIVVIGNMLLSCACNAIVVLSDTHSVKHHLFSLKNGINLAICSSLIKDFSRISLHRSMQVSRSISDVFLGIRSWGEVSSPVRVVEISIREHVIIFDWPCKILSLQSIKVHAGCWIKQSHILHVSVHVSDKSVDREETHLSVLESEVAAHRN